MPRRASRRRRGAAPLDPAPVRPVSPSLFVPIAEESGLINELGAWTLRRACRDALAWPNITCRSTFRRRSSAIRTSRRVAGHPRRDSASRRPARARGHRKLFHRPSRPGAEGHRRGSRPWRRGRPRRFRHRLFEHRLPAQLHLRQAQARPLADHRHRRRPARPAPGPGDRGACRGARPQGDRRRRRTEEEATLLRIAGVTSSRASSSPDRVPPRPFRPFSRASNVGSLKPSPPDDGFEPAKLDVVDCGLARQVVSRVRRVPPDSTCNDKCNLAGSAATAAPTRLGNQCLVEPSTSLLKRLSPPEAVSSW